MNRPLTTVIALAALAGLPACALAEASPDDGHHQKAAWGYGHDDGPAHWGDLSDDFIICKTGREQSPVDLPAKDHATTRIVSGHYGAATASIVDNGHTVQASFDHGFSLTSGDHSYDLLQFHLHTPSENTVDGKAFPMTAHLVHKDDGGSLAVLGLMFDEGAPNPQIQVLLDHIGGEAEIDVAAMLPSDMTVYNFAGSLTTPPCSEGVNWHVLTTPVSASAEQIAALSKIMGHNARPVQPLNDRVLAAAK